MTTEAENRAEQHGKETGIILTNIEHLSKNMTDGFERGSKRFDQIDAEIKEMKSLKCEPNTAKITEFHAWYMDHKAMKMTIFKTSLKIIMPMFLFLGGLVASAYAYYVKG